MARIFPLIFGALVCLAIRSCQADGRVFVLEMQNVSKSGYEWARQACVAHSARLASTADLWHAILECSFSACTRGWMDGATVGTTICKGEGGSGLRTVDVKVQENIAEEDGIRLDAFCVKDKGKCSPCGAPPTFPHTHMQSQTGLELGDELVFVCESGYSLASGDTAFSLLCDSCGEWYGLVQLCVKDDAEAHQDYEDKFPNEDNIYTGSEREDSPAAGGEHEEEGEEEVEENVEEDEENEETPSEGNTEETDGEAGEGGEHGGAEETGGEEGGEVDEEKEEKENKDVHAGLVTNPPVSILSQKHLFWFPSEAFHDDEDHHGDTHASDHKHSGAKEADDVTGAGVVEEHEGHHHGDDHAEEEVPTTDEVLQHTDKSWLDGYPVDEEFTKSTEIGAEEKEAKEHSKEHSKEHELTKSEEEKEVQDVSKEHEPVKSGEEEEEEEEEEEGERENERATDSSEETFKEVIEQPDTAAEVHPTFFINVSDVTTESRFHHSTTEALNGEGPDSITPSGVGPYDMTADTTATTVVYPSTSTTPGFFHHVTLATESNEVTAIPEDITSVPYHATLSPDDVITAGDDLGTPLIFATVLPDDDDITTLSTDVPVLVHDFSGLDSDRHNLTKQSMPTEDPCESDTCPSSKSTSLVAIVTVVTIVAVAGLILGAWLFRRRQLKSSHYQFNGTNSHTQNFEMQQTV
ncbi:hypothetical protein ACEWY4_024203 [Coilia grayii]|uniref:Sushi domain-containing protein 5 n=1 Tax=Coilia grayii TaxID=363190 RepID=A0ABD1J1M4_9TELE